jgi:hypothetical protein
MAKYELLTGKHVHSDGKKYVPGDFVHSGLELDKLFKNKFRRVGGAAVRETSPVAQANVPPTPRSTPKADEAPTEPLFTADPRGIDVSTDYPDAAACGLKVFRRGGWFHVFDGDDTTPKNENALRREDVAGCLARLLEE